MSERRDTFDERHALLLRALARFGEALALNPKPDDVVADAAIRRFEFTVEPCCRVFQAALALEEMEARSPRQALQGAYRMGWINDEERWLAMLEDRNRTSHTYRADVAAEILARLPAHHALIAGAAAALPALVPRR